MDRAIDLTKVCYVTPSGRLMYAWELTERARAREARAQLENESSTAHADTSAPAKRAEQTEASSSTSGTEPSVPRWALPIALLLCLGVIVCVVPLALLYAVLQAGRSLATRAQFLLRMFGMGSTRHVRVTQ